MKTQNELIEKGLQLIHSLPDIMPEQASDQLRLLYADIQHSLRVPVVNQLFRTLGNYPAYLQQLWSHFQPAFCSNNFELAADNLREKALLEDMPLTLHLEAMKVEDLDQIRAFTDTIFYVLPKLMLIATTFQIATFRTIPQRRRNSDELEIKKIQKGIAPGTFIPPLSANQPKSELLKELLSTIKEAHGTSLVSTYYRGLANWPDFLSPAWHRIRPLTGSTAYDHLRDFLAEQAQNGLSNLSLSQPILPILNSEDLNELEAILTAFRFKLLPEILIEVALVKALLDGPEEAYTSCFSVGTEEV